MPESIDWPLKTQPPRPSRHRILIFFVAAVAVVFFGVRIAISYWVDLLWFRSLGYAEVFWKTRTLQWGIFAAFAFVTFLVLYGAYLLLKRAHGADLPSDRTVFIAGNPVNLPLAPVLRLVSFLVSLLIAVATGAAMQAQWPVLALFWYAPRATGTVTDPVFGKPLNFFLFTLPALHSSPAGC